MIQENVTDPSLLNYQNYSRYIDLAEVTIMAIRQSVA